MAKIAYLTEQCTNTGKKNNIAKKIFQAFHIKQIIF